MVEEKNNKLEALYGISDVCVCVGGETYKVHIRIVFVQLFCVSIVMIATNATEKNRPNQSYSIVFNRIFDDTPNHRRLQIEPSPREARSDQYRACEWLLFSLWRGGYIPHTIRDGYAKMGGDNDFGVGHARKLLSLPSTHN